MSSHKWTRRQHLACGLVSLSVVLIIPHAVSDKLHARIRASLANTNTWAGPSFSANSIVNVNPGALSDSLRHFLSSTIGVSDANNHSTTIETTLPLPHPPPGFAIFDRLYVRNKTFYAVTSDPGAYPDLMYVLTQPADMGRGDISPTEKEMQLISPEDAQGILRSHAVVLRGMSYVVYDTAQFMKHYYHWWGEIILGAVRVYSTLSLILGPLPDPARFLLPNIHDHSWRDRAGVDGPLMRAAWPNTPIERGDFWNDTAALNQTFVFERAMIISRPAAHKSPFGSVWYKMIAGTMNITAPANFWDPVRRRVVLNTIGYLPVVTNEGTVLSAPRSAAPVVTYISRQRAGRSFLPAAHDSLVKALQELHDQGVCEFVEVAMEKMTFAAQVELAARTTIMIGIHGNGLTHQLWMPQSPRSTVIEVFWPESYAHDYSMLSRNMGHKHYAVWNDTYLTYPEGEWFHGISYGPGFHGGKLSFRRTILLSSD
ncbi:hypothetical protein D9619_011227 [Psilocybe cf. subviscida]|uniref:Glycosyltransferase 61 catalytic domain-containing protein n=1 Tax=Psilocybe cf. subviscida TaxID=2480587 RepID=A0A8H5BKB1_9AGAR|nr:hypothetical protein D9619_011227 [Psilocybe cf. subviscida]